MPTISIFYGIRVAMNQINKEHNPPHVHAWYGDKEATFLISNGELLYGDFPKRAAKMVKEFIFAHQKELLDMWNGAPYKKLKGLE